MKNNPLPRLDTSEEIRQRILPHCRLRVGETWVDSKSGHKVACIDAADTNAVLDLMDGKKADLAIHDPPYNLVAFEERELNEYVRWCKQWVNNCFTTLKGDSSLYVWLGADQRNGFQPLPDFMIMMREMPVRPRSFITMRNQRGYGTPHNWMSVRQELLYYTKGQPAFTPQYTDLPKTLRGYFKEVGGARTENTARGKAPTLRAGNVWIDVQQVFYRMEENVNGCYAQKPLKAITRIIEASSRPGDVVLDCFAHSGTTLLACELTGRRCLTMDIEPVFAEITRRRLEHYRRTGKTGWQNSNPFARELGQAGD